MASGQWGCWVMGPQTQGPHFLARFCGWGVGRGGCILPTPAGFQGKGPHGTFLSELPGLKETPHP